MVAEEIDARDIIKGNSLDLVTVWVMKVRKVKNNFKVSSLGNRVNDGNNERKIRSIIFLRDGKIAFFRFAM